MIHNKAHSELLIQLVPNWTAQSFLRDFPWTVASQNDRIIFTFCLLTLSDHLEYRIVWAPFGQGILYQAMRCRLEEGRRLEKVSPRELKTELRVHRSLLFEKFKVDHESVLDALHVVERILVIRRMMLPGGLPVGLP